MKSNEPDTPTTLKQQFFEPVVKAIGFILPAFLSVLIGYAIYSWAEKWMLMLKPYLGPAINGLPFQWLVNPLLLLIMLVIVTIGLWIMGRLLTNQFTGGLMNTVTNFVFRIPGLRIIYRFLEGLIRQLLDQGPKALKKGQPGAVMGSFGREDYGLIIHRFTTKSGLERVIFYQIKSLNPLDGFTYTVPAERVRAFESGTAEDIIQMTGSIGIVRSELLEEFLAECDFDQTTDS